MMSRTVPRAVYASSLHRLILMQLIHSVGFFNDSTLSAPALVCLLVETRP